MRTVFLQGNVPSLKNSRVKTSKGVFHSATVRRYLQQIGVKSYNVKKAEYENYKSSDRPNQFEVLKDFFSGVTYPCKMGFHFVRKSRHKFDFHNAVQILTDLMVAHGFLEDDDMDHFIPFPVERDGKWYTYDKENPGVYITIE